MHEQGVIDAARRVRHDAPVAPVAWRDDIMALLQNALASEMMCVLHYTWRRCEADDQSDRELVDGLASGYGEYAYAVRLAQRIVHLEGRPDFRPDAHGWPCHAGYSDSNDLTEAVKANLAVAQVTVARCGEIIMSIEGRGSATLEMLEQIHAEAQDHAAELAYWLDH